jgi:hypothetical protein
LETKPLAVFIAVTSFLAYYTLEIKNNFNRPSLVMANGAPIVLGGKAEGYEITLDRKWSRPSEAGQEWLNATHDSNAAGSQPERFICQQAQCGSTAAVLTILKAHGTFHRKPGAGALDAADKNQILQMMGCGLDDQTEAQKVPLEGALSYYFGCRKAATAAKDNAFHSLGIIVWGDDSLMFFAQTLPTLGYEADKRLTIEIGQGFKLLPR